MSTSSSTPAVSSDVAELKDMVRALILDRKNQTPASAPVKVVEQKHTNFDIKTAGDHRKIQLNELNELRDHAYENSLIYKENP
ncbi:hypothetical protein Tco_0136039 [Tanacetum coccineum]